MCTLSLLNTKSVWPVKLVPMGSYLIRPTDDSQADKGNDSLSLSLSQMEIMGEWHQLILNWTLTRFHLLATIAKQTFNSITIIPVLCWENIFRENRWDFFRHCYEEWENCRLADHQFSSSFSYLRVCFSLSDWMSWTLFFKRFNLHIGLISMNKWECVMISGSKNGIK